MSALATKAWLSLLGLALVMAALLFVPAGTLSWWQGWAFLAAYFLPSLGMIAWALDHDRALLERRMRGGPAAEKETAQKIIMTFTSIGFVTLLVVPGLDHRFGWSRVPAALVVLGDVMIPVWFAIVFFVFRENSFAASTVEIAKDQKVITTGPYAIVRHPMYAAALLLLLGMPLALGSWWAFLAFAGMLPFLLWRMFDEERLLARDLPGYTAYMGRVRWRLVPGMF
jgi:protein-S-isoprenylcysteine O-methyltransferase Ste14